MSHNPISPLPPKVALQRDSPAMPGRPMASPVVDAKVACRSPSLLPLPKTTNPPISAKAPFVSGHIDMHAVAASPGLGVKKLRILGIRGIPAAHGGFETIAEHLALYLEKRGWEVTV